MDHRTDWTTKKEEPQEEMIIESVTQTKIVFDMSRNGVDMSGYINRQDGYGGSKRNRGA